MIAEVIPEAYDAYGRQVAQPVGRRKGLHPTFPMGRYISQPLTIHCSNLEEVRQFLGGCRGVSDKELFGKEDYWQPPEEFEKRKAGDCEDFSLWTWRQLLSMGLAARVVFGRHGRYGIGHAWVTFFDHERCFLVEPQARTLGLRLPRLSTLRYKPKFSVEWSGHGLKYYSHQLDSKFQPGWGLVVPLLPEWVKIWGWFWLRVAVRLPYRMVRKLWRKVRGIG
jgi:Bacterial transglutaminase-like cysteine proteinase BTLCP